MVIGTKIILILRNLQARVSILNYEEKRGRNYSFQFLKRCITKLKPNIILSERNMVI